MTFSHTSFNDYIFLNGFLELVCDDSLTPNVMLVTSLFSFVYKVVVRVFASQQMLPLKIMPGFIELSRDISSTPDLMLIRRRLDFLY